MPNSRHGRFITFEGGDGAGKSTQLRRLADWLRARGHEVVATREPGGSPAAEAIRDLLLSGRAKPLGALGETYLFAAARIDHLAETIEPALASGAIVLCDRFIDSTRVYQGIGSDLDPAVLAAIEAATIAGRLPDLTLVLDLAAERGQARARSRSDAPDRFESADLPLLEARRQGFLAIAAAEPERCTVIDADRDADAVFADVAARVALLLGPSEAAADG